MKELKRILMVVLIGSMISVVGFAQKGGNDNRPPKENPKVVEKPKPPPSNGNSNKREKP
jgi:hypothetical protein